MSWNFGLKSRNKPDISQRTPQNCMQKLTWLVIPLGFDSRRATSSRPCLSKPLMKRLSSFVEALRFILILSTDTRSCNSVKCCSNIIMEMYLNIAVEVASINSWARAWGAPTVMEKEDVSFTNLLPCFACC